MKSGSARNSAAPFTNSGGKPVAAYPRSSKSLDALIVDANLAKNMTPDQVRARQLEASRRQKALDAAKTFSSQVRRRRHPF